MGTMEETKRFVKQVLGVPYSNAMKNQKGLDDVDLWAANVGKCEKNSRSYRVKNVGKKSCCIVTAF